MGLAISKHFPMHPSRLKTFEATIFGAMSSGNCQHYSLSRTLDSPTSHAAIRRIERFFQKQKLSCASLSLFFVSMLDFHGNFDLCLDRSNWEFGDKKINYLVLSWRISKEISLPLFFVELNKAGNSNTNERIDLLKQFIDVFGVHRIKSLKADREFIGEEWIKHLLQHKIPFYIRVRFNTKVPFGADTAQALHCFYDHLKRTEKRILFKEMYGHDVCFVGKKIKNDTELLIVMTNQIQLKPKNILTQYRQRWSIEELFRKLKTSGFNWENTHMKCAMRLSKLLIILSVAVLCAYLMGKHLKRKFKKRYHCFEKTIFRQGLQNFQRMISQSIDRTMAFLTDVLELAAELTKSDG